MTDEEQLVESVRPLVERIGGRFVDPADMADDDVPLVWGGQAVRGIRLPSARRRVVASAPDALAAMIAEVENVLGASLSELDRPRKQRAVRLLEERGAFTHRRSVETVAEALGVSRFTVYNYLNRSR